MTETTDNTQTSKNIVEEGNETVAPEEAHVLENQDLADTDEPDEGDVAADYLEELLDIVDLDGDIEIEIRGERTFISIQAEDGGDELQDLVGPRGEVLDALQELTRLAVLSATGERTRLVLDINGHRAQRNEELKTLAEQAVSEVKERGENVHLEPMSAFERKIVHDFVAEAGLVSESEGEGKRRHVVVAAK
ncbi:Jag family protein [Nesterenkonia flava]|uniref:R3H domain-containing nucleic acid-binding protein n=1 Tax=Nesterenkonia flava TaxID=469799 RepID=A0ABU1FT02_9MICC|nr:R3H domain-containing nucleic acid-binding protein [Nesterenkonia flava]MDR5711793.1 R3H domain-containing nucleic acid-binding protein [Nesterenkonia flava]